ncbi:MAG: VTT domain-containing protein [Myxococcota bacterium]|nr:VTT domain-containing protein [Myxococcota bacterium]
MPGSIQTWLRSPELRGLLLLLALAWLLIEALEQVGGPEAIRAEFGLTAAAILVPLHAVVAVTPFPSELIALGHGAIYGFALGSFFTWSGWMLAAVLEYALFRRLASDVGETPFVSRLPASLRRFPAHHPAFLIGGRLVPFGNHVVNGVAGLRGVSFWRFLWATALALAPFSILVAAVGSGATAWW